MHLLISWLSHGTLHSKLRRCIEHEQTIPEQIVSSKYQSSWSNHYFPWEELAESKLVGVIGNAMRSNLFEKKVTKAR